MNIRRTATILGTVVFGAATLLGSGIAHADAPAVGGFNYGDNATGWNLVIRNDSDVSFPKFDHESLDGVRSKKGTLNAHSTVKIAGQESIFGGPRNMSLQFHQQNFFGSYFQCSIGDFLLPAPEIDCRSDDSKVAVEVTRKDYSQPLEVAIRNK